MNHPKFKIMFSDLCKEDVEIIFRTWAENRFLPQDHIDLFWSEMEELLKNKDEVLIKWWSKNAKNLP